MKAGMVCSIRVGTKDCLAVLDLMNSLGIDPYDGRSFSGCVSQAFATLIQVARQSSLIPAEEDGFQYLNRMEVFFAKKKNSKMRRRLADESYKFAAAGGEALRQMVPVEDTRSSKHNPDGWLPPGNPSSEYRAGMPLDETTRDLLFSELEEINDRKNKLENLSTEEEERYQLLMQQLGYAE